MSMRLTGTHDTNAFDGPLVIGSGFDVIDQVHPGWSKKFESELNTIGLGVHTTELEDLLNAPETTSVSNSPAIIILPDDATDRTVSKVMERLSQSLAAALVMYDSKESRVRSFMHAEGIMCEPLSTSPRDAAMILRTLAQRQPALQRLNTDLRLSEMSINGVQSEVAKLHEELQSAASIQREYLPSGVPEIQGVDLGIIYRPASYVSGDIYDITQLDENRSAFFLADAVGHGVPAALMTMVITQGLRKLDGSGADSKIIEPAEALRRLNNTMSTHSSEVARFATAMYAVYDKSTNEVTIAGAGHPPALVVRAKTGETEMVDSQGPLLGIFADVEFGQTTVKLEDGDVLVFYSDGFEVAFPNGGDDEHERKRPTQTYIARLSTAGTDSENLNQSVRVLEDNLDLQMGSLHQPDDITALFIAPSSKRSNATDALVSELQETQTLQ
ncbi:MAG: PP2C family protein-serine/threonine phosphatase [Phycisphaerales bacterium]